MDQPWMPLQALTPKQEERQKIRRGANFCGILLLAMMAVKFLVREVLGILGLFGVLDLTKSEFGLNNTAYVLLNMLVYILFLVVPTVGVVAVSRCRIQPFPSRFVRPSLFLCLFVGGMAMAVLANVSAGILMSVLGEFGVQTPDLNDPVRYTVTSLVLNIISTAVLPALVEEMIFRGYLMGSLRPYGDGIALVLSAFVFGLFHGNVLQIPFAFILGLVLGWMVIQTGSIWTAVVLHFGNNLMSVLLSYSSSGSDQQTANMINTATFVLLSAAGVAAIAALLVADRRSHHRRDVLRSIGNGASLFTAKQRVWYILTSPAFLLALAAMVVVLVLGMEVA